MALTPGQLAHFITTEYAALCATLSLQALPLDIFETIPNSTAFTALGTPVARADAGFRPSHIALPYNAGNLAVAPLTPLPYPPVVWNKLANEWPVWRIELWHEVCHQVEHSLFGHFNPTHQNHGHEWQQALAFVAAKFGVSAAEVAAVT